MEEMKTNHKEPSAFVSLKNVEKVYPTGGKVVYNFNLDINKNEFIVIVGPSGCGKSTTLRMIAGLEVITDGELYIDGELANYKPSKDRQIAMVFQSYALYPQMSVFDNMAFGLKVQNLPKEEIEKRVFGAAALLDLGEYLDRKPKQLSGGQMQRVALGRAIVRNVPLFLMDEPLSNLDAKLRLIMRGEIVKLHNKIGATTIYVTHDQTEAMTMATRIVVMSKGFIQQVGTPEDIYNHPNNIFVAKFIGAPSMNIFQATLDKEKKTLSNSDFIFSLSDEFIKKHDNFYTNKIEEFEKLIENFDEEAYEYILKVLSTTEEHHQEKPLKMISLFDFLIKRNISEFLPYKEEKEIAQKKFELLLKSLKDKHMVEVGIRPERISLEKYNPNKNYENAIIVQPTVCELLGAEYNIYFELGNKEMVGKMDAKTRVTIIDKLAVSFSTEDIYIFDPITGDTIK